MGKVLRDELAKLAGVECPGVFSKTKHGETCAGCELWDECSKAIDKLLNR